MMLDFSAFIFLSAVMVAFGYMAGNAENFNKWKFALLALILVPFFIEFNLGKAHLITMLVAFGIGFFLPYAWMLEDFRDAISDAINSIRYRDAYEDIKRREAEVRSYAENMKRSGVKLSVSSRNGNANDGRRKLNSSASVSVKKNKNKGASKNPVSSIPAKDRSKAKSDNSAVLIQAGKARSAPTCKPLVLIPMGIIALGISRKPIAKWP